jgi:hypothetical protein
MPEVEEFDRRAATVHKRVPDVIRDYDELLERAEPGLEPLARRMQALHRGHREQLHLALEARGHPPDDEGSFAGLMQEAAIRVRSWVEDLDRDVVPRIRTGEEQLIALYDEAIEAAPAGEGDRAVLETQRAELAAEVDRMG